MNQTKIPWTLVITFLAAVVFGFICFLSLNLLSEGNMTKSAIGAVVITLILGGLCAGAIILKRTDHNFKTCIIIEWILLFLFVLGAAVFTVWPFSHFFAVSANRSEIQTVVEANLGQAETMYTEYRAYADHRLEMYKENLKNVCIEKRTKPQQYSDYGFRSTEDDNTQIDRKMDALRYQLYPSNYDTLEIEHTAWMTEARAAISNWKPLGVVGVVTTTESVLNSWKDELVGYSTWRAEGEVAEDFVFNEFTLGDVSAQMREFSKPTPASLLYGTGLCLLMLLSYLITSRHSRYPGLKLIFSNDQAISEKEL